MNIKNEKKVVWRCHLIDGTNLMMTDEQLWDKLRQGELADKLISTEEVLVDNDQYQQLTQI